MTEIERFGSGIPWESTVGYSRAVRAGPFVFVAGTTAVDEDGVVRAPGDAYGQTHFALDALQAALAQAGAGLEQVIQTRLYVTDIARSDEIGRAHGERFADIRPVSTMVQIAALIDPRMLVEIEAIAYVGWAAWDSNPEPRA
ncbi:MAG: RidA family protein [Solirubrobacteraceae bacterium]